MSIYINKHLFKFKELLKNKYFWISVSVLVIGLLLNQFTSFYLNMKYDSLPVLNDLLLDNLPYFNLVKVYDFLSIISMCLFVLYVYKKEWKNLPFIILLFGISQVTRGIFIGLTPFGSPKIDMVGLFNGTAFRSGVYPSGHTGSSFMAFLLSKGKMKYVFLTISISIMITLLLARGHYTIDIFSAIIFNYAIYMFGNKYFKKKFKINKV